MGHTNNKLTLIGYILDLSHIELYPPAGRRVYSTRYELVHVVCQHIVNHLVIFIYQVSEIWYIQFFSNSSNKLITTQRTSGPWCQGSGINRRSQSPLIKYFRICFDLLPWNLPIILELNCNVAPFP